MTNIYLPAAGVLFSILVVILFFSKKRANNPETKLYSALILIGLLEAVLACIIVVISYDFGTIPILYLFNKLDYILIMSWVCILVLYILFISLDEVKKVSKLIIEFNILSCILVGILPMKIINDGIVLNTVGIAADLGVIVCGFYFILTIIILFTIFVKDTKKLKNKKFIPIFILMILYGLCLIIREHYPNLLFESLIFSYIGLMMYHTIENPDVKMIEKLEIAKECAEKANRAKTDFLSSMSHEIRTPLNAIVGLSESIAASKELPKDIKEDANDIVNASNTLLEIVGNILDINKIESDKMELVEQNYNFKEEIESLIKVTSTRIAEKPISLSLNISNQIPDILLGDKIHVKMIINNLVSNAIKYTEEGYIKVNITCENIKDICNLKITVEDTGKGIKPENIDRLFNKFDRLDVEKKFNIEGTGLGLTITKLLVELMKGSINVESQYGKGSVFTVKLPQLISKKNIDEINEEIQEVNFEGLSVLIVDDNNLNIKVARKKLTSLGIIVDECLSGEDCIKKIKSGSKYDLILMDIMMPNMSGDETLKNLNQIENFKTPVIALTADALSGAEEKYKSLGFCDYISKPFSIDVIQKKLSNVFNSNINLNISDNDIEELERLFNK